MSKDKKAIIEVQGAAITVQPRLNAELIHIGLEQGEQLRKLNDIAIRQLRSMTSHVALQTLGVAGNVGAQ